MLEKAPEPAKKPDLAQILGATGAARKRSRRGLWLGAILLLATAGGGYYYFMHDTEIRYNYTTEPVKTGDLAVIVTATGSVQPTDQVEVSSELSGTIRKVNVNYNSTVKAGDVLAELDTNKLEADVQSGRARVASAKANVLKSEAELNSSRTSYERLQGLVQNRISSQQDLDAARFSFEAATAAKEINEASVLSAEADLRLAQVNLAKAKIVSPIDGVVLTRAVDPGATVASSFSAPTLFTIAGDLKKMELQVSVDEADVGQVTNGQSAVFRVDAYPDRTFPSTIEQVRYASETVANVVTYKAVLTVDNAELLLRPGMTATADITVESVRDALLIPNAALRYTPPSPSASGRGGLMSLFRPPRMGGPRRDAGAGNETGRSVYVLRNNVPVRARIETGPTDGRFTVVRSGDLKDGDTVITDATARQN